ncbi:MAG: OadG family protein [Anaerolineae bacterium]|nr:OadG family protein [Anaerolineae bacterium]
MPDPQVLLQGLTISISGLLITFISLGLFILIISGLQMFFPAQPKSPSRPAEDQNLIETRYDEKINEANLDEVAAAIGFALTYWRAQQVNTLGQELHKGPGPYWRIGQINKGHQQIKNARSKQ